MNLQEITDLRFLFGRAAVDAAIARKAELSQWAMQNPKAITEAASGLKKCIKNPYDALDYVDDLNPRLRAALIITILEAQTKKPSNHIVS